MNQWECERRDEGSNLFFPIIIGSKEYVSAQPIPWKLIIINIIREPYYNAVVFEWTVKERWTSGVLKKIDVTYTRKFLDFWELWEGFYRIIIPTQDWTSQDVCLCELMY